MLVVGGGQQAHGLPTRRVGNGRAMSVLFAREGAGVAVADLDRASAEETAGLCAAEGADTVAIEADAADEATVGRMLAAATAALGGLDGLVLNVGIGAGFGVEGTSVEDWDRVLAVNLRSHFLGCKHGLPLLAGGGSIVLVGSLAGTRVHADPRLRRIEGGAREPDPVRRGGGRPPVRVNLLVPGLIDTSLGRMATQLAPDRGEVRIPLRRQGTAWEVAYGGLYLLSDEAAYVTGSSLVVDGGLSQAPRR